MTKLSSPASVQQTLLANQTQYKDHSESQINQTKNKTKPETRYPTQKTSIVQKDRRQFYSAPDFHTKIKNQKEFSKYS